MKTANFDARAIANRLLDIADSKNVSLTNLHLQKVIFFSHGNFYSRTGLDLVINRFEAWAHGPVVPELYHALKQFDERPVIGRVQKYDFISKAYSEVRDDFSRETDKFLDDMVMSYGRMNAWDLVKLSHTPGSPWATTIERSKHEANFAMIIEVAAIRDWFRGPEPGIQAH